MPDWVEEKIDWILVTDACLDLFGEAKVESIRASLSDHLSLILRLLLTI